MVRRILTVHLRKHAALIKRETGYAGGFMRVLMKQRNTEGRWTAEEKSLLRNYLGRLAAYVPVLLIFLLPFGSLLMPVLAEILDRREGKRGPARTRQTAPELSVHAPSESPQTQPS